MFSDLGPQTESAADPLQNLVAETACCWQPSSPRQEERQQLAFHEFTSFRHSTVARIKKLEGFFDNVCVSQSRSDQMLDTQELVHQCWTRPS